MRAIQLSLNLILHVIRTGRVIRVHPPKLIGDVIGDMLIDLGLALERLLIKIADRIDSAEVHRTVILLIIDLAVAKVARRRGPAQRTRPAFLLLAEDIIEVMSRCCRRSTRCLRKTAVDTIIM